MKVADIILEQLGGNKFVVMTGASHFVSDGNTLRMQLPRNISKANRLILEYRNIEQTCSSVGLYNSLIIQHQI